MALAQAADRDLPGRDPGAAEIEPLVGAGKRPKVAAPADALARFENGDAQAARGELAGRGSAGEAGADDQHVAGFFGHRRVSPNRNWYPTVRAATTEGRQTCRSPPASLDFAKRQTGGRS